MPSLRRLGTTSTTAAAGDDSRFGTPSNAQVTPAPNRVPLSDGTGVINPNWLANVGPGAGTYGGLGSYLQSVILDAKGNVVTPTFATAANANIAVTNLAALAALDLSALASGTVVLRWLVSRRRFYYYDRNSTLTPNGVSIVAAVGGGNFVEIITVDPFWLSQLFWAVDPVGGNDDSPGCGSSSLAAQSVALKTMDELDRRLYGFDGRVSPLIQLMGDVPPSDARVLTSLRSLDAAHYVTILGTKTLVGTYTLTTYAAGNPAPVSGGGVAGGTQYTLTATGIGGSGNVVAESMIDHLVVDPLTGASAFILANLSANQAVVGEPTNADPSASQTVARGSVTPFTNGNTINVYRLSKLPIWPFPVTTIAPVLGWVTLQNPTDSGIPSNNMLGPTAPRIIQCNIAGGVFRGGYAGLTTSQTNKGVFASCTFSSAIIEFISNISTIRSCSLRGAIISLGHSYWNCVNTFVMEASSVELSGGQFNAASVCCFNSTDAGSLGVGAFVSDAGSQVQINNVAFWGAGNTDYAIYCTAGSVNVIRVTTLNWLTNKGWDLWVATQNFFFADIATGKAMLGSAMAGVTDLVA